MVTLGKRQTSLVFDSYPYPERRHPLYDAYEPEIVDAIERFIEPGDCAIDVGASVGFHTCLMAKLAGEQGVVLAFEPQLESFNHLAQHVHVANQLNNVACLRTALWKEDCPELTLYSVEDIGYSTMLKYDDATRSETVEGRALDTLLLNEHPRLIKIDVEGFEAEVLWGAQKILERGVDCVILEFNYQILTALGRTDQAIRDFMKALGYDMFFINMADGEGDFFYPTKVSPDAKYKLDGGWWVNVMFSTEEKVRHRYGDRRCNTLASFGRNDERGGSQPDQLQPAS
jgi:FkbM family methyltransferase